MKKTEKQTALAELEKLYPDAKPALHYSTAYELLVAVVLSAQCTDERVNKVTAVLFQEQTELILHAFSLKKWNILKRTWNM